MRRQLPILLTSLSTLVLWPIAACSGPDSVRDAGDAARGLVRIDLSYTRAYTPGSAALAPEPRFDAEAHFARFRGFDAAGVATLLGVADFDGLALDRCRLIDRTATLDQVLGTRAALPAEVALLDAGRLELRAPGGRGLLEPRQTPEVVPFVSGTVYGGNEPTLPLALGQLYEVIGRGGSELGSFSVAAQAPRAFPDLRSEPLRRGDDLQLRWAGAPESFEPLTIELSWASRGGAGVVRCRVRDDGEFLVPREVLSAFPRDALLQSASLSATRVARAAVQAPFAGSGDLTISLRDVLSLRAAP